MLKFAARTPQNRQTRRSSRPKTFSPALSARIVRAGLLCAALSLCTGQMRANAATWTGAAGDGLWSNPLNWSGGILPGSADDVVNNGNDDITYSTGASVIASFLDAGAGVFRLTGGSLTATKPGVSIFQVNGSFIMNGGTLSGFVVNGSSPISFLNNSNKANVNILDNITANVGLSLTAGAVTGVTNGLTLNGATTISGGGAIAFENSGTLGGTATITLGDTNVNNRVGIDKNSVLTIGSGITIHGVSGQIGPGVIGSGGSSNTLINNGIISSDGGGMFYLNANGGTTNNNLIEAKNHGQIFLVTQLTMGSNGKLNVADSTGTIYQYGYGITGGTINVAAGGEFAAMPSTSNFFNSLIAFNGTLDLTGGGRERVTGGLTLGSGSQITIGGAGALSFQDGDQTLGTSSGTATVLLADSSASNRVSIEGNITLTLGSGITIYGNGGQIGASLYTSGTGNLINNGTIQSGATGTMTINPSGTFTNNGTVSSAGGGTLNISSTGTVTNNNVLEARNASTLNLNRSITNGSGGQINVVSSSSIVNQNGVSLTGGTINNTAGGKFTVSSSDNNFLNAVTVNGTLNLSTGGHERITGGLVLGGGSSINIGGGGLIDFSGGNQTLGTSGSTATINFADNNAANKIGIDGNMTLTVGSGMTLSGNTGTIGSSIYTTGTGNLINNGAIKSTGTGTITINPSGTFTNGGTLSAVSGSTLAINQNFTQTAGQTSANGTISLASGTGTLTLNGGTLTGSGTLQGNVINNASLLGTDTPTSLIITGSYTQGSSGRMNLLLSSAGTFSFLTVSGSASLDGLLDVSLQNGFIPTVGETFTFLNYGSRTGSGQFTVSSANAGYTYLVNYASNNATLSVLTVGEVNMPEPGTLALLIPLGVGGLVRMVRLRRR